MSDLEKMSEFLHRHSIASQLHASVYHVGGGVPSPAIHAQSRHGASLPTGSCCTKLLEHSYRSQAIFNRKEKSEVTACTSRGRGASGQGFPVQRNILQL
jgi:hypothetical protein